MPYIRHLAAVILVLSVCVSIGAQEDSVLTDRTYSVESTEQIGISEFLTNKQYYLDSLSVVFSGSNLHIFNDALLCSIPYGVADSTGSSMRAGLSSLRGNTMQTAISMGTFSSGIDYVAAVPLFGFDDSYGSSWPDFFFSFTLTESMSVTITHEASEIDTRMSLLDSNGTCIAYNDDYDGEGHCNDTRHAFIQSSLPAGTYYIVSEGEYGNAMICLSVYGNTSGTFGYSSIPSTYSTYSTSSRVIGTMGTQTGVSAMGGATCSVPIKVPQGVGCLQPQLAIVYNSQAGNGIAGYGASLTGLSSITRGPKDIYHDGSARGMTYGADDALYLDGMRLVLESGTPGQDGAVYTPESDPFSKVIAHGTCTNTTNSTWYEVRSSDGMVYWYGYSQDSRLSYTDSNGAQKIHSWYLCHAKQPTGNYMTFYYQTYSNCVYPYMITYGTNINQTSTLSNIIEFTYESRNDSIPIRFDGMSGVMDRRLKTVSCSTNGTTFRTYTLNYNSTSDGTVYRYSRLTSITEKNSQNQSLPATQLSWSYLPATDYTCHDLQVNLPTNLPANTSCDFSDFEYMSGDLNGDGLYDIVGVGTIGEEKVVEIFYGSIENGELVYRTSNTQGDYFTTLNSGVFMNVGVTYRKDSSIVDIDGDGINELVLSHYDGVENDYGRVIFDVYGQSSGHNRKIIDMYRPYEPIISIGDVLNNGKNEILVLETSQYLGDLYYLHILRNINDGAQILTDCNPVGLSFTSTPRRIILSDFNGNGKTDLLVICEDGYKIYWGGEGLSFAENLSCSGSNLQDEKTVTCGDFNGDGLLDFLTESSNASSFYLLINQGNGSFSQPVPVVINDSYFYDNVTQDDNLIITNSIQDSYDCTPFDFDYDGRTDLIITKSFGSAYFYPFMGELVPVFPTDSENGYTITKWLRSDGTGFSEVKSTTYSGKDDHIRLMLGDFDNDGICEVAEYGRNRIANQNANDNTPQWRLYRNNSLTARSGKVISVTGDYGATTSFTYTTLTDGSVYTRGTQYSYPAPSYTIPISVVKRMTQDYGTASVYTTQYSYEGLRAHLQGRGLLGFSHTTATNTTTGITTESGVTDWNSTYYVPVSTYTRTTISGETSQTATTLSLANKDANGKKRYFIHRSRTVETDMDQRSVTTSHTCDTGHGYILRDSTIYYPGMYRVVSYSDYVLAGGAYRPQSITTTQKHTDDSQTFSTTALYTYDSTTGVLIQRIDNSQSSKPLTTTYAHDVWGNITSDVSTGNGITTPLTTYYEYDTTHRFPSRVHTTPSSSVKKYTYDLWGNVLTERDSVNASVDHTTQHTYDSWGNLIRTQIPGSGEISYTRGWGSDASRLYYVLEQGTSRPWVKTWYDSQGREVLTESVGLMDIRLTATTEYNIRSEVVSTTSVQGDLNSTISYTYDSRGRVTRRTSPGQNVVEYSYSSTPTGSSIAVSDNGRTTTTVYDAMGNVKEVTDPVSTVSYYYSSHGWPRRIETENCVYEFIYDNSGNRISYSDPDAGTTTYTYDALGRETGHTDARNVHFTTNYDVFGRITSQTAGDETITYTYGTTGTGQMRLVSKTLGEWSDTYEYDQYGRLVSLEAGGHTATYQYNSAGLLTKKTWGDSSDGKYVNYTYDTYGNHISSNAISGAIIWNLTQNTGTTTASTMKLNSNPTLYTRTVTADSYGYPASYFLNRGNNPVGGELYTYNYSTGNLTQCVKGINTETYSYDDADRLTSVHVNGSEAMAMTYSSSGNLFSKTGVGNYAYSSGSHRLSNVDNTDDVIPYSSQSITYNAWGKVAEVNETIGSDTYKYELTYGPDLQRVLAVLWKNNSLVHLVTYGDGYEEKYQNGHITNYYYVDGADGNSAVYTSNTQTGDKAYCIDRDHLGSVTALFDQNGNKCFSASFDPWGRRYVEQGSIEYDRGYTGHEHIDELGLIDMNGRMYDPILGRFISVDPYIQNPSNPQNFNRYAYCLNNPVRYTDPTGNSWSWASALFSCFLCPIPEYISTVITTATTNALIDGTIGLLLNGGWNEAYNRASNSLKIDLAPFNNNERWNTKENLGVTASMFLLQADAMALGNIISHFHNVLFKSEVTYTDGAILINHDSKIEKKPGGMTLGSYINGRNVTPDLYSDATFRHEYGHTLQSLMMGGTSYLSFVAWPSLLGCLVPEGHETEWYEEQSNMLSTNYCKNNNITFNSEGYLRLIGVTDNQKETRNKDNEEIWNKSVPKYSVSWRWFFIGIPIFPYCLLTF